MNEKRAFYEVGHKIYYLTESEVQLLVDLSNCNLLKFTPKQIDVYGIDGEGDEPADIDSDFDFDPCEGCYAYDC